MSDELDKRITETEGAAADGKRTIDIEAEGIGLRRRLIVGLTWPALAEGILTSLLSMADMMMVSVIGEEAINAVGLVTQPRFVMLAAFMALAVGSTAMAARFKGARDRKSANTVFSQSILMTLVLSVALCVLMLCVQAPFVRLLAGKNISESSITQAISYLHIQILGFPTLALTFSITAVLRGTGNTRASFYCNTLSNVVNIFFNYCMIGGNLGFPRLGVAGASIATVIGQCAGLLLLVVTVLRGRDYVKFDFRAMLRPNFPMLRRITRIGVPALWEQLAMRAGMLLFTMLVTSLGDNTYTAHMVAMNIQQISFTTGMAFGVAATTLTGQSLGRNRADLARVYHGMVQRMGLIVSIAMSLLLFFGGGVIGRMYTQNPEIIGMAALALQIIAVANPISNARFVVFAALRGAGDSRYTAVITFLTVLILRPFVGWLLTTPLLPFQTGLPGIWVSLSLDAIVCFIASILRYRRGKWAKIQV